MKGDFIMRVYSNEIVFRGHPDKVCDQIADALLDAYMKDDKNTRAGIECTGGKGVIFVTGEVTSKSNVDVSAVVHRVLRDVGYSDNFEVINNLGVQSPDIAQGVDIGGAGDQGMMFGYACNETEKHVPKAMAILQELSRVYDVLRKDYPNDFYADGKAQITGYYDDDFRLVKIKTFTISYQNSEKNREFTDEKIRYYAESICKNYNVEVEEFLINPTGKFLIGGFDGDAGVVGRKIVVDSYQSFAPVGGGAFCLPIDSIVSTNNGEKLLKDVKIGDRINRNGCFYPVVNKYLVGEKKVYELKTSRGYSINTAETHLFKVLASNGKYYFKKAKNIVKSDYLVLDKHYSFGNYNISESYFIGYVLGDGWLNKHDNGIAVKVPVFDRGSRIYSEFKNLGGKVYQDINKAEERDVVMDTLYICNKEFREYIENIGLSSCGALNKNIPSIYYNANKESTVELLRGLFDSDGSVSKRKGRNDEYLHIIFSSASKGLIESVQYLLLKLGILSNITLVNEGKKSNIKGREINSSGEYLLEIVGRNSILLFLKEVGFCLDRKKDICNLYKIPTTDTVIVPNCISVLNKYYKKSLEFRKYLRENHLDSLRKTITLSGRESNRGKNLTTYNIEKILEFDLIDPIIREFLVDKLNHFYVPFKSLSLKGSVEMMDIEVDFIHEYIANGFVVHNSGKDPTKVDRSGAYKARQLAIRALKQFGLKWCSVQLSYAIGKAEPLAIYIDSDKGFIEPDAEWYSECTPRNMIEELKLKEISYEKTARFGHFGFDFNWEK